MSLTQIGIFSFCSYPYRCGAAVAHLTCFHSWWGAAFVCARSLKLLWSPFVDTYYWPNLGALVSTHADTHADTHAGARRHTARTHGRAYGRHGLTHARTPRKPPTHAPTPPLTRDANTRAHARTHSTASAIAIDRTLSLTSGVVLRAGRRKSWIVPSQLLIGAFFFIWAQL